MKTTLTGDPSLVLWDSDHPPISPFLLLKEWLDRADTLKIIEPRGLVLSTVDAFGKPSSRVVLLKTIDDDGVIFCSSETSQKGRDIQDNPVVAGTLWWRETMQQINFYGWIAKLSPKISDDLFRERSVEAQAVAALSLQSAVMTNERVLRESIHKLAQKSEVIVRPKTWVAYHIRIESIEFWHGNINRFHNRLRYDLIEGIWHHKKLQP